MRKELEDAILTEFPFMQKGLSLEEQETNGRIDDLYSAFGFEFSDGWFELVRDMLREIAECYKKYNEPVDFQVKQCKEKMGSLRTYYKFGNDNSKNFSNFQAIDFLGSGSIRFSPGDSMLHKEIGEIVHRYEEKSKTVCIQCGAEGAKLRKDLGWIIPLCDTHYNERVSKMMLRQNQTQEFTRTDVLDSD